MAKVDAGLGDGPVCPEAPAHGNLYGIPTGLGVTILWCAVSNAAYAPAVFNETTKQFEAGKQVRRGVETDGHNAGAGTIPSVSAEPLAGDD